MAPQTSVAASWGPIRQERHLDSSGVRSLLHRLPHRSSGRLGEPLWSGQQAHGEIGVDAISRIRQSVSLLRPPHDRHHHPKRDHPAAPTIQYRRMRPPRSEPDLTDSTPPGAPALVDITYFRLRGYVGRQRPIDVEHDSHVESG